MQIETRRHIVHRSREIAGALDADIVTLPRAPWEPSLTATGHRPETAPDPRITLCRTEARRVQRGRVTQMLAAIRQAYLDAKTAPPQLEDLQ